MTLATRAFLHWSAGSVKLAIFVVASFAANLLLVLLMIYLHFRRRRQCLPV